jgi:cell division protein FtsB
MRRLSFNFRRAAVFFGIMLLVLFVIEFNSRLEEMNRVNGQLEQVRAIATQAMQTQMAFETQVAYAKSEAAVEEWARTEGHYLQDGDQVVIPLGQPGSEPVIPNTPVPTPTPLENWEVWRILFFDE